MPFALHAAWMVLLALAAPATGFVLVSSAAGLHVRPLRSSDVRFHPSTTQHQAGPLVGEARMLEGRTHTHALLEDRFLRPRGSSLTSSRSAMTSRSCHAHSSLRSTSSACENVATQTWCWSASSRQRRILWVGAHVISSSACARSSTHTLSADQRGLWQASLRCIPPSSLRVRSPTYRPAQPAFSSPTWQTWLSVRELESLEWPLR